MKKIVFILVLFLHFFCYSNIYNHNHVIVGAERVELYYNLLVKKQVGLVVNQTAMVNNILLVDYLLDKKINIKKIFAPEHGFRGTHDAGAHILNSVDRKTGIPIISLYGSNKKPNKQQLSDLDIIIFDIQDVGVRFYTYISTLHYVLEACAENNVKLIIFDRPNPNGFYVDGPILEPDYKSFVGMHPVPIVHGMTIGEYATMVNNEYWLKDSIQCELQIIKCKNYNHNTLYELPIKPSPNLPNNNSIYLYPSLCFFEGTYISAGRGTHSPFQCYGAPDLMGYNYSFKPRSIKGASLNPKFKNVLCKGELINVNKTNFFTNPRINLQYLINAYENSPKKSDQFFNKFFYKLCGNKQIRIDIENGLKSDDIRDTWKEGILNFKKIRKKYLLYKDFE